MHGAEATAVAMPEHRDGYPTKSLDWRIQQAAVASTRIVSTTATRSDNILPVRHRWKIHLKSETIIIDENTEDEVKLRNNCIAEESSFPESTIPKNDDSSDAPL